MITPLTLSEMDSLVKRAAKDLLPGEYLLFLTAKKDRSLELLKTEGSFLVTEAGFGRTSYEVASEQDLKKLSFRNQAGTQGKAERMGGILQACIMQVMGQVDRRMDPETYPSDGLEDLEEDPNKNERADDAGMLKRTGVHLGEFPQGLLAHCQLSYPQHNHEQRNSPNPRMVLAWTGIQANGMEDIEL